MKTVSLRRTCFIFVVLSLVVAACERQVVYGQKDLPIFTDDAIVDQVRIKLASDIVQGGALTVDCKNGVVTLTGPVETEKQKARAE